MPQFKFAVMNCGSKHADKAPKLQIHVISQLTNKYKYIFFIYIKRKDNSDGKNPHTFNGPPSYIHSGNLEFFSDCHQAKQGWLRQQGNPNTVRRGNN